MTSDRHHRPEPEEVLEVIREVAAELQPGQPLPELTLESDLDRDAGMDSLGRVELMLRLQQRFTVQLQDDITINARTPSDLLKAVSEAPSAPEAARQRKRATVEPARDGEPLTVPEDAETLIDVLDFHAGRTPDRVHLLLCDEQENEHPMTFSELLKGADETATGLRTRGLEPGQPVAIMLPTGADFFFAFHGILRAGGIPVPMYPPFRPDQIEDHCRRLASILRNAETRVFIASEQTRPAGRLLQALVPELETVATVDELRANAGIADPVPRAADSLAFLQYSSGTTGVPKGVMLTHANLLTNIRVMGEVLEASSERDVFVSWLPLYHDMGLIGACLGTLYFGIPLVLMSPLHFMTRPQRWLWAIHRHGGTISAAPNFAYDLCAGRIDDEMLDGLDLSSWRLAVNGAEPVSPRTLERFCDRFTTHGFRREAMTPVYGLAEASVGMSFPPLDRGPRIDRVQREPFERKGCAEPAGEQDGDRGTMQFVACGSALPGHAIRVVDDRGEPLPERQKGNLQFRGPSCTQGYYRHPEATRALFDGEWLNSGDLAYLADGEVHITGRTKDLIIRAGRNIYPYEVERAVSDVPGIRKNNVAAFSVPDPQGGPERLVVMAETRETDPQRRDRLHHSAREAATSALGQPPDEVVLVPPGTVIKTSSGKIRRGSCREIYESGKATRRNGLFRQLLRLSMSTVLPTLRRGFAGTGRLLFLAWCWLLALLIGLPAALVLVIVPGIRIRAACARIVARALIRLAGVPLTIEGDPPPPGDQTIIAANHQSYLDGLVLRAVLKGPILFVSKRELRDNPLIHLFVNRMGAAFVDRQDHQRGLEDLERIRERVKAGETALFFPEGTFTKAAGLRGFRVGPFMVSVQTGVPVLPLAIRGTRSMLRGKTGLIRPGRVTVTLGPPIVPEGDDWNAALVQRDRTREFILAHCGEPDLSSVETRVMGNL